jgi:tetratricopeptide (TPR) repeat protein
MASIHQEKNGMIDSRQHMLTGIDHLQKNDFASALFHFDHAIALRESIPWQHDVESAWLLAAAWLNRSDALRKTGHLKESISSLDRAIEAMDHVPLAQNPAFADRLILAWINRATACDEAAQTDLAVAGFTKAEDLLATWALPTRKERRLLAVMLHGNRAHFLLATGDVIRAWHESQFAVNHLRSLPPEPTVLETAIIARGIQCKVMAALLDTPGGPALAGDWIACSTDAAEEALSLAKYAQRSTPWLADLVRYGAKIYRVCQPHFLGEYLHDCFENHELVSKNPSLIPEALHELALAKIRLEQQVFHRSNETDFVDRSIKALFSLQTTEREIAQIARSA